MPFSSVASSQFKNDSACAFWLGIALLIIQSSARPSLCSLRPPTLQSRGVQMSDVVSYVDRINAVSLAAPTLVSGEQMNWPWYPASGSTSAGRPSGTAGGGGSGTSSFLFLFGFLALPLSLSLSLSLDSLPPGACSSAAGRWSWSCPSSTAVSSPPSGASSTNNDSSGTWSASPRGAAEADWAPARNVVLAASATATTDRRSSHDPLGSFWPRAVWARTSSKVAPGAAGATPDSGVSHRNPTCPICPPWRFRAPQQ